ncbi:hypothetical protein AG1IA_01524 [Rhizoctonia solani AG-1 IA]|uniref:Uncharacterized protein n=1 Tax=Thanatephorus cucumeris (strain AG1-IA) TaxID=983506 RepID=L8X2J0_THACA|nr:hypothetical protein AG1IA_01524 [Rhizoctonia solani AG-1 IA]
MQSLDRRFWPTLTYPSLKEGISPVARMFQSPVDYEEMLTMVWPRIIPGLTSRPSVRLVCLA